MELLMQERLQRMCVMREGTTLLLAGIIHRQITACCTHLTITAKNPV